MANWNEVTAAIVNTGAKNVRVDGNRLMGNDGTVLTFDPKIAAGYVKADWDAINCCVGRR